jgi:hypothetical protein
MNYTFSKREKVMLVILAVIVIGLGYFKLILEPINNQVDSYASMSEEDQLGIESNTAIIQKIRQMNAAIEQVKADGGYLPIPSYDNSKELFNELYAILDGTLDYQLSFENVAEDSYVVLRPITMTYKSASYEDARAIIDELHDSSNLNQISDVIIINSDGIYSTSLRVTYFEVDE